METTMNESAAVTPSRPRRSAAARPSDPIAGASVGWFAVIPLTLFFNVVLVVLTAMAANH
jgi:hypothetical protein